MADDDFDEPELWDEYQWEKFLQQQDRSNEKFFRLLEQYLDHPQRDEMIAQAMGWDAMDQEEGEVWEAEAEFLCEIEEIEEFEGEEPEEEFDAFVQSPIYGDTLRLHHWVNSWMQRHPEARENPEAIRLASKCAVCGAKLAAALCGDDGTELGMTIAYLKRALKAANESLDAAAQLVAGKVMSVRQCAAFHKRLFCVRNRIVDFMSHYRAEFRKRQDAE